MGPGTDVFFPSPPPDVQTVRLHQTTFISPALSPHHSTSFIPPPVLSLVQQPVQACLQSMKTVIVSLSSAGTDGSQYQTNITNVCSSMDATRYVKLLTVVLGPGELTDNNNMFKDPPISLLMCVLFNLLHNGSTLCTHSSPLQRTHTHWFSVDPTRPGLITTHTIERHTGT